MAVPTTTCRAWRNARCAAIDRSHAIDRLIDEDNLNNYFLYVETIFIYFVIKKHIIDLEYDQP